MSVFTDQLGNTLELHAVPRRIVSLVPSQTELLFDLGLDGSVLGITKFCVHPAHWYKNKTRVGGTKTLDIDKIKALRPDLVIANKEENVKEQVQALQDFAPVWTSDVNHLEDALAMIAAVGALTGTNRRAAEITQNIRTAFDGLAPVSPPLSAAYLIWKNPYMSIGGDTFISDMMARCGFKNVFGQRQRYPETSIEELKETGCGIILLSSEPYPFKQEHADELKKQLGPCRILLVDGEMFSWYGSRLQQAPAYFRELLTRL